MLFLIGLHYPDVGLQNPAHKPKNQENYQAVCGPFIEHNLLGK